MAKYWMRIGQTVYGGKTGYTEADLLEFIAQQQVLENSLVSVNIAREKTGQRVLASQAN